MYDIKLKIVAVTLAVLILCRLVVIVRGIKRKRDCDKMETDGGFK
jgi:hypothetical protein